MAITAAEVNELRKLTGAGLMDCKKALQESNGDIDSAIDYLRKKGQKVAAKRADREATEGVVIARTTDAANHGIILCLSCETDFVAKNEGFIAFANQLVDIAFENKIESKDDLMAVAHNGVTVSDMIDEQVGKIGEKIEVAAFDVVSAPSVVSYIHANYKVGVLVGLNEDNTAEVEEAGRNVAMQIAAMKPVAVSAEDVDASILEKEREIGREKALAEGKPEAIVDKIVEGSVQKFLKENTLLSQQFVKDSSMNIEQYLQSVDKGLTVTEFKRVSIQ